MQFPGEALVIRLWDSVEKLSIGALNPYQQKRLENQRRSSEISELLHENKLAEISSDLELLRNNPDIPDSVSSTLAAVAEKRNREEKNVISSIAYAQASLEDGGATGREGAIDTDWMNRWYDYASRVTNDDLQQLWGKILAGEVRKENSVSYRLMDFIDKLTSTEIDEISLILSMVETSNLILFRGEKHVEKFFEQNGIDSNCIQKYTDLGVLGSSTTGIVNVTTNLDFTKFNYFTFNYAGCSFQLSLKQEQNESKSIRYYSLGTMGQSLMHLSNYTFNQSYLDSLSKDLLEENIVSTQCS
ncbi:DUF2806 domain-containing protein [Vibrio kanaloae]|uniref:DUF2806 domain-containing protein n=1 Tax=Vibrio kanaloae TaxID=170673 RepID=UPI0012460221|nr:DUF2806 domain-containing protein [Vibrio kanaloae]KAB0463653.1 DUF2806 domain-containing protein [Vibrio kanaloae]